LFCASPDALVGDHDHEGEQQPEQRCDDAEHLRGHLGIEPLARRWHMAADEPHGQNHRPDDQADDNGCQQPDRHVVDDRAHRRNLSTPAAGRTGPRHQLV